MKLSALRGTGVAIVTPFQQNGKVDYNALEKIIQHVIDGGIDNLVSLGTTGETPVLSTEEKMDIVRFTLEKVDKRVPLIVGIGGNNTFEVIRHLETYPLDKVMAVLSVCPAYNRPSPEGLYQHYKAVAEASPKPVIMYNVPARTGRNIPVETTLRLAREVSNIVAIKEASANMIQCMQIVGDKPEDFTIISGDDMETLAQIACGLEGVISVAGNFMARDMVNMVSLALDNQFDQARRLHYKMMPGFELMFAENNPAGIKAFLTEAGLCENNLRLPNVPVSYALMQKIRNYLSSY